MFVLRCQCKILVAIYINIYIYIYIYEVVALARLGATFVEFGAALKVFSTEYVFGAHRETNTISTVYAPKREFHAHHTCNIYYCSDNCAFGNTFGILLEQIGVQPP